jgi:hypothetical protein
MGYTEISTRISLRWLPDPPSEPTDTLVYNVGSYFLDLRVLKDPKNTIDWAMAGVREVLSRDPRPCPSFPKPLETHVPTHTSTQKFLQRRTE